MDDKGFIFTADATLALVVVIVFTASILVYGLLPVYQGQDHQHLQALADSALATMEEDGTLRDAAVYYANNNSTAAEELLTNSLNSILPSDVSYKMTMNGYIPQVINNKGRDYSLATDVATGVRVISGPKEGWLGRSFYNIKEVGLTTQDTNVTTTLWNFHNWLTNFSPWSSNDHLDDYPNWGSTGSGWSSGSYKDISFSVPNTTTGTVNWARFIANSVDKTNNNPSPYSANVVINSHSYQVTQNQFLPQLYSYSNYHFYNYQRLITPGDLTPGTTNNLHINYGSVDSTNDMAWFSLIANYTVSMVVPQGVVTKNYTFPDLAGLAYPGTQNNRVSGMTYNLLTGATTSFTNQNNRMYDWNTYITTHPTNILNSNPFIIEDPPGGDHASAIAIQQDIDNRDAGTIKDAYVVINPYGAVDGARVEVYHPSIGSTPAHWDTIFSSNDNTQWGTDSGYGNLPGIINIKDYMDKGYVNKVRITVWDVAPGVDYDLVGLTNCYAVVSSSKLPIQWDEYPTVSDQSNNNQIQKDITYTIRSNSTKEAYLFFSGGLDTKSVKVEYTSGKTGTLYNGAAPYLLNLGELDESTGLKVMTNGTVANHTYIPGNYTIKVTVTSGQDWESGDGYAEIFSGTRVAVIYPALDHAVWSTSYAPTAQQAINEAYQQLVDRLAEQGFTNIDPKLVYNESMYTGDLPNSIPVRLDLWTY